MCESSSLGEPEVTPCVRTMHGEALPKGVAWVWTGTWTGKKRDLAKGAADRAPSGR